MSTLGNNYVGAVGPDGFRVWRPTPYPLDSAQGSDGAGAGGQPSGGGSTGGTTQPGSSDGNVQAQALFLMASCQPSDAVGNFVRADTGTSQVVTVTCYQGYPSIGCIISKSSSTACVVQTYGLNKAFSGLTPNSRYFVGPAGAPVLASDLPGNAPYVQPIGFAVQATQLFIQPSGTIYRRDTSSPGSQPSDGGDTVSSYGGALLNGDGEPPDSVGSPGDYYIQNDGPTGPVLFGPKPNQYWATPGVSLVGPAATPGNRIFWGDGPPPDNLNPSVNDAFFDRTNGVLYQAS